MTFFLFVLCVFIACTFFGIVFEPDQSAITFLIALFVTICGLGVLLLFLAFKIAVFIYLIYLFV